MLRPAAALLILSALLSLPSLRAQEKYGPIRLEALDTTVNSALTMHGYAEYRIRLTNTSQESHLVELIAPHEDIQQAGPWGMNRIVRRLKAGPGADLVVSLLQPPLMLPGGGRLRVRVDGQEFERAFAHSGYHASQYGQRLSVLLSPAAQHLQIPLRQAHQRLMSGSVSASPGVRPPTVTVTPAPSGAPVKQFQAIVAEQGVRQWSSNWLAHSRFDALALSSRELSAAPAAVQQAIYDFVALGGTLVVLGPLPAGWPQWPTQETVMPGSVEAYIGFGGVLSLPSAGWTLPDSAGDWTIQHIGQTANPLYSPLSGGQMPSITLVTEDIRLPVRGLFLLTVLFALLLGPANVFFLHRRKRRVWLWWTVPATALATTGLLIGFALFVEGSQVHVRTRSMTMLDERSDRAFTLGDQGFYSTRTLPQGILFNEHTEAVPLLDRESGFSTRRLLLQDGLRFEAGWLSARIPIHFQLRQAERRRERLPVKIEAGSVEVTNGLGAHIQQMWFCAPDGGVYWGSQLAPGQSALLKPSGRKRPQDFPVPSLWRFYYAGGWETEAFVPRNIDYLRPGTYVAVLSDAPFVELGVPRVTRPDRFAIVFGISSLSPPPLRLEEAGGDR
ncbi:MAG TPA: hypothetical protein VLU25_22005 [Acidobacteriota bacterium]|nr:hypothetical protein [Acidobacteriota bacterium]